VYVQPKKGGHPNIARCSPSLFHSFMHKVMIEQMRNKIEEMGFKGVLNIAARSLKDRDFLTWLMDRFNPENITLEISGGKSIEVTEYAKKCMFDLPSECGDPLFISDSSTKEALMDVAA
jgi:EAL domain-containing protein (putative c-di-GMP-specific phosphodiesterase class I)